MGGVLLTAGTVVVAASSTGVVSGAVTSDMLTGVLNEVIALIPIAIPAMITYAGIRKGVGFLKGIIKGA